MNAFSDSVLNASLEHYEDAREHPDPDGDGEGERENGNLVASSPVDRHNTAETPHH